MRVVGFASGDRVTLFGQKDADGRLSIEHLYAGSYELFIQDLEKRAHRLLRAGIIAIGVAVLFMFLSQLPRLQRWLKRK